MQMPSGFRLNWLGVLGWIALATWFFIVPKIHTFVSDHSLGLVLVVPLIAAFAGSVFLIFRWPAS